MIGHREPIVRPILFTPGMAAALWAGQKTVTRRLASSPLGKLQAGDALRVREPWRAASCFDHLKPRQLPTDATIGFAADGLDDKWGKARPAMFMPTWASRMLLRLVAVDFLPLQRIDQADAVAEGVGIEPGAVTRYQALWRAINGDKALWNDNPMILRLQFSVERLR